MSVKPCALMTAYAEGSIVSRELHDLLNNEAEAARFERELSILDPYTERFDTLEKQSKRDIRARLARNK